jgi:hypothetical protein
VSRRLLAPLTFAALLVAALGAGAAAAAQLTATWVDNSNGTAATRIERRSGTGSVFTAIADVPPGVTVHVDTSVSPGITYCYRALAYDEDGVSPYSEEACAAPPTPLAVSLSSPTQGATIDGTVSVVATASAAATRVSLLLDGVLVATYSGTTARYAWDTSTTNNGAHRWVARAYDSSAATVDSSALDVVVNNVTPSLLAEAAFPAEAASPVVPTGSEAVLPAPAVSTAVAPVPAPPPAPVTTTPTVSTIATTVGTTTEVPVGSVSPADAGPAPVVLSGPVAEATVASTSAPAVAVATVLAPTASAPAAPVPAQSTPVTALTQEVARVVPAVIVAPAPMGGVSSGPSIAALPNAAASDRRNFRPPAPADPASGEMAATPPEVTVASASSAPATVSAPAPTLAVSLIAPGGNPPAQGTIRVAAVASLAAVYVELWLDGSPVVASPGTRITYAWDTTSFRNGAHRWTARAYGAAGETVGSIPVDVIVGNVRTSPARHDPPSR